MKINAMKTMIEAIESLTNEDVDRFINNLEELKNLEDENRRNICENILINMLKQYNDVFYRHIRMNEGFEEEISKHLKELK